MLELENVLTIELILVDESIQPIFESHTTPHMLIVNSLQVYSAEICCKSLESDLIILVPQCIEGTPILYDFTGITRSSRSE